MRKRSDSTGPQSRVVKASGFRGNLAGFFAKYKYQPCLTKRLDDLTNVNFTPELLNEIVLWKVNRFVLLERDLLDRLDALRTLKSGEHRKAHSVIDLLLRVRGVDLPMASTFLRFRNSRVFQIIDRHAYRALYGKDYPYMSSRESKIERYFDYLDCLRFLCAKKRLEFETTDRVLYVFDKKKNGGLRQP